MIFQKRKPIEVNYFIDTPSINLMDYPKGLFPNIEKFPDHRKTGCPAVKSTDKRIYRVKAPFNVDIRVYMDNGRVMIEWEYDVNQLKVSDPMNNLMSEMFVGSKEKNGFVQVQHQTPYIFATDDPDLEMMQMPPTNIDSENLEFISGAFHPYAWLRTLNASYSITDPSKDARIKFKTGDDLYLLLFNKPVDLKFAEKSLVVDQFHQNSRHLVFYRSKLGDIYDQVLKRRPKRLIERTR